MNITIKEKNVICSIKGKYDKRSDKMISGIAGLNDLSGQASQ